MAVEVERYIVELGTEGRLIEMQLEETMVGVAADKVGADPRLLGRGRRGDLARDDRRDRADAAPGPARLRSPRGAARLRPQGLDPVDFPVSPRGYRVLGRIPRLPKLVVQRIIQEFGGLEEVLAASVDDLEAVEGVGGGRAKDIREGLRRASRGRPGRPLLQS